MLYSMINMKHILFLNRTWGVDHMLMKKLERENIEYTYVSMVDGSTEDKNIYRKYDIRSTPCLLVLDNDKVTDTLKSTDEIIEYLKNVQNTET